MLLFMLQFGVICTFPLLLGTLFDLFGLSIPVLRSFILRFALATPVQFIVGAHIYKRAVKSALSLSFGVDFLVVLGSTSAYVVSVIIGFSTALAGGHAQLYFEFSSAAICLATLGNYLEARVTVRGEEASSSTDRPADSQREPHDIGRVARLYMFFVIFSALVTFGAWHFTRVKSGNALVNAMLVFVISCPCTLGMTKPLAILSYRKNGAPSSTALPKKIRWNIVWALAFTTVGIPFAAIGLLNPGIALLTVALAALSVVANSFISFRNVKEKYIK